MKEFILALVLTLLWMEAGAQTFVVAQDGSGDFTTVQEAVDAMPDYGKGPRIDIVIKEGIYREKVDIRRSKHNLRFIGDGKRDRIVIVWNDYASKPIPLTGIGIGTSGTATVFVHADRVSFENITFANDAGRVGQAVAVMVSGDMVAFYGCAFLGNQDTLYTWDPRSRQYYEDCYIEGTVDFIFGFSTAYFRRCTIRSLAPGYVTAASTPEGQEYGYVFEECRLTASPGVTNVYLGRPWRPFAQTVFIDCFMDDHIVPAGWHNWDKPEAERTSFYGEYASWGAGADNAARVEWSHRLSEADLARYDPEKVLGGDWWKPMIEL